MQRSGIQGNFLTSGKTVKGLVMGLSSLYLLIAANESINQHVVFKTGKFWSRQTTAEPWSSVGAEIRGVRGVPRKNGITACPLSGLKMNY